MIPLILNLLEELEGRLPEDKPALLSVIDRFLDLPSEERLLFQLSEYNLADCKVRAPVWE